jgi:hypothetical protein
VIRTLDPLRPMLRVTDSVGRPASTDFEFGRFVNGLRQLEAKGSFKLAPGARVVATITLPGHKPDQVRFTLK